MRIAVEGCAHGELELIYDAIAEAERFDGRKVDLLLCCGDFQATRNSKDLTCMAVPNKYKDIGTFYKYYSGEKVAPILTIFIGGNHEASNYLQELAYGGWVAPNIYYLGYAGVVTVGGLRIAGLSGIYKSHDYMRGHHEYPPYNDRTIRSAYHIRNLEIFRLKQLSGRIDMFMTHDWPLGITDFGNVKALLRKKSFLKRDIDNNVLGSPPGMELLKLHYPSHWFAAHLHCKFEAKVTKINDTKHTKFLALDKCLPRRNFLEIIDVEHDKSIPIELCYDLEWLTILFLTNHLLSIKTTMCYMPGPVQQGRWVFAPTEEEKNRIHNKFSYNLTIPLNFKESVEPYNPEMGNRHVSQPNLVLNEQTTEFCNKLAIDDPFALLKLANGIADESELNCSSVSFLTSTPSKQSFSHTDLSCSTEDDEAVNFIIDTSPSYTLRPIKSLKLPAAKNDSTMSISDSFNSDIEIKTDASKSSSSVEIKGDHTAVDVEVTVEPNCKKLKRRNQSIYTDAECIT
ncbi:PREDICTED: lariat debranching enzyme [Ceratosolen solmsi marchali]|uniref:Lariat debranching enzyme n=1 Tax=Ceratosolen solmsi marchali TaxID=326594 RepID=A0AAJ6VN83_9HYME|nr:PREDICTED: lariat debranching enzyme [Ceratosolen solmsi marchali]